MSVMLSMDHSTEQWLPIPGHAGYEASSHGRIRSWRAKNGRRADEPHLIQGAPNKDGYIKVTLSSHGKQSTVIRSVLVAITWLGERPAGLVVCHANGVRTDDRPFNLQYKSQRENIHDKYVHGTMAVGSQNPRASFDEATAREIFLSPEPANVITERLGLNGRTAVDAIRSRKTWRHVTDGLTQPKRAAYARRWKRRTTGSTTITCTTSLL